MSDVQAKKKKQMLSSYSIVFLVLIVVAILTWFVPQSVVIKNNGTKEIIYNAIMVEGKVVTGQGLQPMGLWDILMAPIRGFVKAAPVGFAILMAGSFLHLMNHVGAMNSAIGWLLKRFTGKALIIVLMFVSALFGAVYGLWEEIPAYSMVVVPLFVLAGYDVITGIGVLFVGATAGNMASIVNPFSLGAAVGAIGTDGLSMGSGMLLRIVIFFVLYVVGLVYMLHYADTVKRDPTRSIVHGLDIKTLVDEDHKMEEFTSRKAWSITLLVVIILALVCGYMPWDAIKFADGSTMKDVVNLPFRSLAKALSWVNCLARVIIRNLAIGTLMNLPLSSLLVPCSWGPSTRFLNRNLFANLLPVPVKCWALFSSSPWQTGFLSSWAAKRPV